jgi:alkaline phosphatase D
MNLSEMNRRRLLSLAGGMALFAGVTGTRVWAQPVFGVTPFALGVASGDPWPDGFVIWTRLAPHPLDEHGGMPMIIVPVKWEVAEDEAFAKIVRSGEVLARPELGHSVHVEIAGLKPSRPYFYRFMTGGDLSRTGRVRTAPFPGDSPERVRLAVAGCQNWENGYYTAYRHLSLENDLDAVFHYGDYIYESKANTSADKPPVRPHVGGELYSLDDYRRRYAQYRTDADLQAAHAAVAFITSFDDHEIDNNWASAYDQDNTPPEIFALRKAAALQAWYENSPVRLAQFPTPTGVNAYRRLDYGQLVRMHVLDTRSYRDKQPCRASNLPGCRVGAGPETTIMGKAQEAWLDDGLVNQATWNLIAQQVLVMPLDSRNSGASQPDYSDDNWNGYPEARHRLVKSIMDRRLTNVVIATGDAHETFVGNVPVRDEAPDGPVTASEFLAASISSGGDGLTGHAKQDNWQRYNPNLKLLNSQRGYQIHDVTAKQWLTQVRVVDRVTVPDGTISTLTRFVVVPQKAGAVEI